MTESELMQALETTKSEVIARAVAAPIAPFDWVTAITPIEGAYQCRGKCGTVISLPGLCDPCAVALETSDQNEALSGALRSIPSEFRWAHADAPELGLRVKALHGKSSVGSAKAVRLATAYRTVLIVGTAGSGKTSLACAILRAVIDAGRYPARGLAFDEAKYARFYAARSLAPRDWRESQDPDANVQGSPRGASARCRTMLIDDVGQEAGDDFKANERSKAIADVLNDRHDMGLRTIITTPFSEVQWNGMYGDGVTRRCWDEKRSKVIRLDEVGSRGP